MNYFKKLIVVPLVAVIFAIPSVYTSDFKKNITSPHNSNLENKTLAELKKLADQGDSQALCLYGDRLYLGGEINKDYKEARKYFKLSANKENPFGEYNYAIMLQRGEGGPSDSEAAFKYFKRAADKGHIIAQYNLAILLAEGKGCEKNFNEARAYYKRSADAGFYLAQNNYATLLYSGSGGKQDLANARKHFKLAAEQGHDNARFIYAYMLYKGEGGLLDLEEAATQFELVSTSHPQYKIAQEIFRDIKLLIK